MTTETRPSVRDMVHEIQVRVLKGGLTVDVALEDMNALGALLGNVNDQISKCKMAYNQCYLHHFDVEGKANRARIKADTGPEYAALMDAQNTKELVVTMIGTLKYLVRNEHEHMKNFGG